MNDEEFMQHMETEHSGDMRMSFLREPDQSVRRLNNGSTWRTYHETLHRLDPAKYDHGHLEEPVKTTDDVEFIEREERIWVVVPKNGEEAPVVAYLSEEPARRYYQEHNPSYHSAEPAKLYRPTLAPIYGGETLKEALWSEMDRLMEALMTGTTAEDGGDKFRAQELAWVIAITSNPYAPSVDQVRAEAMERWNTAQAALNPDQEDPADRYEENEKRWEANHR